MELPCINERKDLLGKRVILRAGLNVPLKDGAVANLFRLKKAVKTIEWLKGEGAKVIILAHIGRDEKDTLEPVAKALNQISPVSFFKDMWGDAAAAAVHAIEDGQAILLENIRQQKGETENDEALGKKLAGLGEIFVNDAFADSHRNHASIVGIARHLPSYAGFLFAKEVEELSHALQPVSPSLFILGGAKFDTKQPILKACLPLYDSVFVGGALAHDFFKEKGFPVGKSLVSENPEGVAAIKDDPKVMLPVDVTVQSPRGVSVKSPEEVGDGDMIMDCGPKTIEMLQAKISEAQCILWNGPLGNYELGFSARTEELARMIAKSKVMSIVGGGDTVAAIDTLKLEEQFTFVSTGGGAMLDFLADGTLPAIDAINASPK